MPVVRKIQFIWLRNFPSVMCGTSFTCNLHLAERCVLRPAAADPPVVSTESPLRSVLCLELSPLCHCVCGGQRENISPSVSLSRDFT